MQKKKRHPAVQAGFTLIELMIVVVIILILAGVAYYGYRKWIDKSKTTEANLNLKAIYNGAKAYFVDQRTVPNSLQPITRQLPTPSAPATAAANCCAMGGALAKCAPNAAIWQVAPWTQLKFAVDDAHYFAYAYQTTSAAPTTTGPGTVVGDTFNAQAIGDLDCDTNTIQYDMQGIVGADGIQGAGAVIEVDVVE